MSGRGGLGGGRKVGRQEEPSVKDMCLHPELMNKLRLAGVIGVVGAWDNAGGPEEREEGSENQSEK